MANNGQTSSDIANNILDAFNIIAQAEVNSAQFDKTVIGIIVSCEDAAAGKYKVQYQDAIFIAYSSSLDITYSKGTSVQVKIPNNDFSGRKMIIGTVKENGLEYGIEVEDPLLRYEMVGGDCVGSIAQSDLSSYWDKEKNNIILYDVENNINLIDLNTILVNDNIIQGNSLILGASIRTAIPENQRFNGNYGIKYTLTFNDITDVNKTIDRIYNVDIDKMSGDPYNYEKVSNQLVPFDVDSKNFVYVKKIELYAEDFPTIDNEKEADIFISNIRFQVANTIPDEEFEKTALNIILPEGNYFSNSEENIITKKAVAEVKIKGKLLNSTQKQIQYYWFIEDLRVSKTDNINYLKYAGLGWRCLNKYNVVDGEDENPNLIQYVSGTNEFIIEKSNSRARETRYKCVAIYNGIVLSKEFSIMNYDIDNIVSITSSENTDFIDCLGQTTLTCNAKDGITYKWAKIDAEGGFGSLPESSANNREYENAVKNYNDLKYKIDNKITADGPAAQKQLKSYKDIIDKYDYIMRCKGNQIINLQAGSIFKEAIFKCQAFDENELSLGIASQRITNTLKEGLDTDAGNLTIINGTQIFKYDAKGISPASEQWENPQAILPLSFSLRTKEGVEIPQSALRESDVSWIVPTKDTMLNKFLGTLDLTDEELGIQVYKGKNLSYTIKENYYSRKDNNQIELQVRYKGILYTAKTNFLFLKDGDDGTNGTGYVLRLIPNNTIGRLKTVKAGAAGSDWIKLQLWYNGIKIYEGYGSDTATTGKDVKVTWSLVGDRRTPHNISVISNGSNPPNWRAVEQSQYNYQATDIAKVTIKYDNKLDIYGTLPIIYSPNLDESQYKISLKDGTGFTHVVYSEDGKTPVYDNKSPFELEIQKLIDGEWGTITGDKDLTYDWQSVGNIKLKDEYTPDMASVLFEVDGDYDSDITNTAVICTVRESSNIIGTVHIPIHYLLDTYGRSAINGWDGNSIQLDADENKMLLAPQAGFGDKNRDNSFNGVLLGAIKDYSEGDSPKTQRGLMGYYKGVRTIFLNSDDGSATFGATGKAQIILDPSDDKAIIKSGNYDRYNGTGMMIDLSTPEIRYGSGNFVVDSDGYLEASGVDVSGTITAYYGSIGGWNITPSKIYKGMVGLSSDNYSDYNKAFWAGSSDPDYADFAVDFNGNMLAKTAEIGSGSKRINIGRSTDNYSAIYYGKENLTYDSNGFYIGTNGIALGRYDSDKGISRFQVNADGTMYSEEAYISGTIDAREGSFGKGENKIHIGGNSYDTWLYSQDHDSYLSTSEGFYLGTDGWSMGEGLRIDKWGEIDTTDWIRSMTDLSTTDKGSWIGMKKGVLTGGVNRDELGYITFQGTWSGSNKPVFVIRSHTDLIIDTKQLHIGTYEEHDNVYYVTSAYTGDKEIKYVEKLNMTSKSVKDIGDVLTHAEWNEKTQVLHFKNGILVG